MSTLPYKNYQLPPVTGKSPKGTGGLGTIGLVGSLAQNFLAPETINKTIGQVISNGFDFKCWGSTWTPKKAENALADIMAGISADAQVAMQGGMSGFEERVNLFFEKYYERRIHERHWLATTAKDCTRKGLELLIAGMDAHKDNMIQAFKSFAEQNGRELISKGKVAKQIWAGSRRNAYHTVQIEQFELKGSGLTGFVSGAVSSTTSGSGVLLGMAALALLFGRKFVKG